MYSALLLQLEPWLEFAAVDALDGAKGDSTHSREGAGRNLSILVLVNYFLWLRSRREGFSE